VRSGGVFHKITGIFPERREQVEERGRGQFPSYGHSPHTCTLIEVLSTY